MEDFEIKQGAAHLVVNHLVHSGLHPACFCFLQLFGRIITCTNQRMLQSLSPFIQHEGILLLIYYVLRSTQTQPLSVNPFKLDLQCNLPRANIATTLNCPIGLQGATWSLVQYVKQLGRGRVPNIRFIMQQQQQSTQCKRWMKSRLNNVLGNSAY